MPNPNANDPKRRYLGQQPEQPGQSSMMPPGLEKKMNPSMMIRGSAPGMGRPDFGGMRGGGGGFNGMRGLPPGLSNSFFGGNPLQSFMEKMRKRRQFGGPFENAQPAQEQRLGRYLGGNGGY